MLKVKTTTKFLSSFFKLKILNVLTKKKSHGEVRSTSKKLKP